MNAIMTNFDFEQAEQHRSQRWEGLSEIDQAIRENRLTEYRFRKAWADPWARGLSILVLTVLVFFVGFVIYWDVLRG
ncbi:hypothetical protein SxD43FB_07130 [Sphingobium sp. D43FB]|nr:hypothetical protein [Sphingobium sp. D43FB]PBN44162.1 hypothetical protein SxD43FB_07130 [Sphingobium sp. D43FB]